MATLAHQDVAIETVDPITFEIISHRLYQITQEIGITLERVGGTVNTTQMHDYMAALYRPNGDVLAAGQSSAWHVASASVAVKRIIERFQDDDGIEPGDMFLLNDPYVAAIHQSDVYIISPIHMDHELVGWSATFVHVMDIGAMSPGGNSPGATDICHEGLRIPGIKLIGQGKLRRDVFDAFTNMTRKPGMVGLDLKCEIAANNVARARLQDLCSQYGAELVAAVSAEMIRYSERILRSRLLEIPDGSWTAKGLVQTTDSWTAMVTLTKTRDHLLFDFTGTDAQASVGINLPYHATLGACFGAVQGLLGYDIPKNHGAFGPIEVIAPPGTILNVRYPAPVSLNTTSGGAVAKYLADAVLTQMAATSDRWRDEVMAKNVGGRRARHAGVNQYGGYYVSTMGGLAGSGARAARDGVDTGGSTITVHNIEWVEASFPLLYLFRRQIEDGGGAGRFRGGAGDEVALILHDAPQNEITCIAYGVAGAKNSGQGLFGGFPGAPSRVGVVANTSVHELLNDHVAPVDLSQLGEPELLGYTEFHLGPNDVFFLASASGGGYGDPLDRDPDLVAADTVQGLVSASAARTAYGVVLDDQGQVDRDATRTLRSQLRRVRRSPRPGRPGIEAQAVVNEAPGLHPLRAHLEICRVDGADWIRCTSCQHLVCASGEDWAACCERVMTDPAAAGPLTASLTGQFLLQQLCCPSCGALFDTDLVEVDSPPDRRADSDSPARASR